MAEPFTRYTVEQTFGHRIGYGDLSDLLKSDLKSAQTFIPLDIAALRDVPADLIQRVNGDTDPCLRVKMPAGTRFRMQFPPVPWPPDLNPASNVVVHLVLERDDGTDDCDIDVLAFENSVGAYAADTEMGGKTAALTTTNPTEVTVTLAATNITGHPGWLSLALLPDAHTTDNIYLYSGWLEYTRALRSS